MELRAVTHRRRDVIGIAIGILLASVIAAPRAVAIATTCTSASGTVTVTAVDDVSIDAAVGGGGGGEIFIDSSGSGIMFCDDATVANTDRVDILAGENNIVDILGGPEFGLPVPARGQRNGVLRQSPVAASGRG